MMASIGNSVDQKAKTIWQRSPDHMVERDNKGKTTEASAVTKLSSSPENTQRGPGTKQNVETNYFSQKQESMLPAVPPDRGSPSEGSSSSWG